MNVYFCILIRVKMRKIEHIGIAVHNLENSNELFSKLIKDLKVNLPKTLKELKKYIKEESQSDSSIIDLI